MVVGVCHLDIIVPEECSLKGKRKVIKSLMARVRDKFNVSIAEVGGYDLWQRTNIGICVVGNDRRFINTSLDKVIDFVEALGAIEVIRSNMEFVHFNYAED
jgi:hypothetical protein